MARRRGLRGLAYVLIGWAAILSLTGILLLFESVQGGIRPAPLLLGGAILFVIGLALVLVSTDRKKSLLAVLRILRWSAVVAAFGALIWGILGNDPRRNLIVMLVVALGVLLSIFSQWMEGRFTHPKDGAIHPDRHVEKL